MAHYLSDTSYKIIAKALQNNIVKTLSIYRTKIQGLIIYIFLNF